VLEVGSGLGILAADIAASADAVEVVGVEQSSRQLQVARVDPRVRYVQADAHALPFGERAFDLTFCRYVLEHVGDPTRVVGEMRRVTRPGGRIAACENDITLARLDPPCPVFERVWDAFARYQQALGGDAQVGRRLFRLFREAGCRSVELSLQPEAHWHGSRSFGAWLQNLIGNLESARAGLTAAGVATPAEIDVAIAELHKLVDNPGASATFTWNRVMALED
jgi:SAM-dependent methyltransferase